MINVKDLVTLNDGHRYCVGSKTVYLNEVYYVLIDFADGNNFKICKEKSDGNTIKMVEITDEKLIQKLILSFSRSIKNDFKD